jgi:pyruvate,orthophosphate dikinase
MKMTRFVYEFEEANSRNKQLFGGKGAGLAEMTRIGLPVPPGFTITTEACQKYFTNGRKLPKGLVTEVNENVRRLEKKTGKLFGKPNDPLFVSVRSGSAISMPGMMDTILNLGLNDEVAEGLAQATQNRRFAYDAYRRLIQLFGKVAMGLDDTYFDVILGEAKKRVGARFDTDLQAKTLEEICDEYKKVIKKKLGQEFPQDPWKQIEIAVEAVFRSWMGKRAVDYRKGNSDAKAYAGNET